MPTHSHAAHRRDDSATVEPTEARCSERAVVSCGSGACPKHAPADYVMFSRHRASTFTPR